MLPISNFFSTITAWMYRVFGVAIIIVSLIPYEHQSLTMGIFISIILLLEAYCKDVRVIRHQCR